MIRTYKGKKKSKWTTVKKKEGSTRGEKQMLREHLDKILTKYKLEMLCTTRQNLFSKSSEITAKRMIYDELLEMENEFSSDEKYVMCVDDEIIDGLYANAYEGKRINEVTNEQLKDCIREYVASYK